ncbi:hypothetical protein GCM10027052_25850 [Parafrigoribacterium mesophilum]|uniref:hypothetical protein n=1 Tax=Parafrigoribacterium mesophilum TaxID=433646 RepID=UPI0031FC3497
MARTNNKADVERWLDGIDPNTDPGRDGHHLRAIGAALTALEEAEDALRKAIADAHAEGDSWHAIGAVLGTSRQAAHRKFARKT